ncbi:unnamed protein product [Parnassius mnemosyne]|uniref:Uncharacterized protein n=1 Tax=Parnassius mnemosyne TaxID=213953 RepID=A0AAV1LMG6_9NEOP
MNSELRLGNRSTGKDRKTSANSRAHVFSIMEGTPSGPIDLLTSRERSALRTKLCVNRTSGMDFLHRDQLCPGGRYMKYQPERTPESRLKRARPASPSPDGSGVVENFAPPPPTVYAGQPEHPSSGRVG